MTPFANPKRNQMFHRLYFTIPLEKRCRVSLYAWTYSPPTGPPPFRNACLQLKRVSECSLWVIDREYAQPKKLLAFNRGWRVSNDFQEPLSIQVYEFGQSKYCSVGFVSGSNCCEKLRIYSLKDVFEHNWYMEIVMSKSHVRKTEWVIVEGRRKVKHTRIEI